MTFFSESRFPTDVSYGVSGGPMFHTEVVETSSGEEYRNMRTPYSKNKYNVASGIKNAEQLHEVMRFFRAMKGKAVGFRFKDWFDYQLKNQFIAHSDGKIKKYQLIKSYEIETLCEVRKISKPVKDTVMVFIDGIIYHRVKVDYTTGEIILYKAPKKGGLITVDCEFDVPVRFDTDHIAASIENYGVYSAQQISLVEIKI